ncbi:Similar to Uncharacterized ATPase YjoB; acc. no. O34703 [Pyronema omphalodes CBS 100304]|uniref:Similar to Uncharacterized ATPase YjoB acc. no. O34703 n=1 Tax=Pyronema omphalodes (strain CBS 100304) TaxID=1076935 RepID=U4L539_PYROM|nr:Similar to Uncharacterized ATPase YjoB; acc. no. O34703 [Pyronema omphalodes CBS 100304]
MTHGPAPLPTDTSPPIRSRSHSRHTRPHPPPLFRTLLHHSSAPRQSTDLVISSAIRSLHPKLHLTIIPSSSIHLLDFASAGHATCILDPHSPAQIWQETSDITETWFGKYKYVYQDEEFILYVVQWKDSLEMEITRMQYLLGKWNKEGLVKELLKETEAWEGEIGERIWVFDQGRWKKEAGLWGEIQKAKWGDVVLEKGLKERVKGDVERFFGSRERYKELGVPWKRGVIFHGPPGNGKTISIKALMHTISDLDHPVVPNLYVKTFHSMYGDEKSISDIFQKAREVAPCLLVFEDLDSLVSDGTRSYFLNEVDGLASNDGICMIGSTNHLDRLDPGIAKRPSRFDRKYLFPIPGKEERVEYCKFWHFAYLKKHLLQVF